MKLVKLKTDNGPMMAGVEFKHARRDCRRPELAKRGGVKAITTCVIVTLPDADDGVLQVNERSELITVQVGTAKVTPTYMVVEHAVCQEEDNFSRAEGRRRAFLKAVGRREELKANQLSIWSAIGEKGPLLP